MRTLPTSVLAGGFAYGEGPRWHDGRLWFADVHGGAVMTLGEDGVFDVAVQTEHPSGLGLLPDGTLVISTLFDPMVRRVGPDGVSDLHDLSGRAWSTNDLVVGPTGCIYVDLYQRPAAGYPIGDVVLITPDGEIRPVASDLATPNGMAITADGSTLLLSETFSGKVLAFTIEPDGGLCNRRVFADLGAHRRPDGICVDAEGAVWVGSAHTGEFLRVRAGGEITDRIETPGRVAVATALGGADRRTLFLIMNETTPQELGRGVSSGRVEYARVDVPGAGWP